MSGTVTRVLVSSMGGDLHCLKDEGPAKCAVGRYNVGKIFAGLLEEGT